MIAGSDDVTKLGRRTFLCGGSLMAAAGFELTPETSLRAADGGRPAVRIGLVADLHSADKPHAGNRYYRESTAKLAETVAQFKREATDFSVELGDFVDAAQTVEEERAYLEKINAVYNSGPGSKHYVLGNHCVQTLTKEEFLGVVGQRRPHDSFDQGGFHFVVLDACFRNDGASYGRGNFHWTDSNIPAAQIEWLQDDLKKTRAGTFVFVHQRLDVDGHYGVKNAAAVRQALEASGKVKAVFQGHNHKNDYREISGIHYCTLPALVDGSGESNNAYATVDIHADGTVTIRGFRRQKSYAWKSAVE